MFIIIRCGRSSVALLAVQQAQAQAPVQAQALELELPHPTRFALAAWRQTWWPTGLSHRPLSMPGRSPRTLASGMWHVCYCTLVLLPMVVLTLCFNSGIDSMQEPTTSGKATSTTAEAATTAEDTTMAPADASEQRSEADTEPVTHDDLKKRRLTGKRGARWWWWWGLSLQPVSVCAHMREGVCGLCYSWWRCCNHCYRGH